MLCLLVLSVFLAPLVSGCDHDNQDHAQMQQQQMQQQQQQMLQQIMMWSQMQQQKDWGSSSNGQMSMEQMMQQMVGGNMQQGGSSMTMTTHAPTEEEIRQEQERKEKEEKERHEKEEHEKLVKQLIEQIVANEMGQGSASTSTSMEHAQQGSSNNQQQMMMQMMMNMMQQQKGWGWGNKQPTNGGSTNQQQVSGSCQGFADMVFLLDSSGSIGDADFKKQLDFVSNVAGSFELRQNGGNRGYQISVATFSDVVKEEFPLNRFQTSAELQRAISAIPYTGQNTNTDKALMFAKDEAFQSARGGRYGAVKIVVVLTDGRSNVPQETERMARAVKADNMMVVVIGIGNDIDPNELNTIASSDKNVFRVENYDVLATIKKAVEDRACTITIEAGGAVNTTSSFDWNTYLKWCAQQQQMIEKKESTNKLLEAFQEMERKEAQRAVEKREEARRELERQEMEKAAAEKKKYDEDHMPERIEEMAEEIAYFDQLEMAKLEMMHRYNFKVAGAMMQFCPLGKYADDLTMFMQHEDSKWEPGKEEHCNVEDMQTMDKNTNPSEVARQIANLKESEQLEIFFGGLKSSVCAGLMEYLVQLETWAMQYPAWAAMFVPY